MIRIVSISRPVAGNMRVPAGIVVVVGGGCGCSRVHGWKCHTVNPAVVHGSSGRQGRSPADDDGNMPSGHGGIVVDGAHNSGRSDWQPCGTPGGAGGGQTPRSHSGTDGGGVHRSPSHATVVVVSAVTVVVVSVTVLVVVVTSTIDVEVVDSGTVVVVEVVDSGTVVDVVVVVVPVLFVAAATAGQNGASTTIAANATRVMGR